MADSVNVPTDPTLHAGDEAWVVCVDLDGVIGDYLAAFRAFVANQQGRDPEELEIPNQWEIWEANWGMSGVDDYLRYHEAAIDAGLFQTMPFIDGASDALWALSDEGFHIRVVTHRLTTNWRHAVVVADTVRWLQQPREDGSGRPMIPYRDLAFTATKSDVAGNVLIDDSPANIVAVREARRRGRPAPEPIVFDHVYNRHVAGPRARNWGEAVELVRAKRDWLVSNPLADPAG